MNDHLFARLASSAVGAVLLVLILPGCSKQQQQQQPKTFTFVHTYSPTPREHAAERYSDFKYEVRKLGETNFQTFLPKAVTPTKDGSVEARFEIAIAQPAVDERYEIRTSYRLDGKLNQGNVEQTVFSAAAKKGLASSAGNKVTPFQIPTPGAGPLTVKQRDITIKALGLPPSSPMSLFDKLSRKIPPVAAEAFRTLRERSVEELRIKTDAHNSTWHLGQASWFIDQDAGTIVFTAPDGTMATCPVQIIGTYNTADGTWLWGWDHPSVTPPLQENARKVRAYGEQLGIDPLTTRKIRCTETDAWELTALACKLEGAQGAYRAPSGKTLVFVTFGEVRLNKPTPPPISSGDR